MTTAPVVRVDASAAIAAHGLHPDTPFCFITCGPNGVIHYALNGPSIDAVIAPLKEVADRLRNDGRTPP